MKPGDKERSIKIARQQCLVHKNRENGNNPGKFKIFHSADIWINQILFSKFILSKIYQYADTTRVILMYLDKSPSSWRILTDCHVNFHINRPANVFGARSPNLQNFVGCDTHYGWGYFVVVATNKIHQKLSYSSFLLLVETNNWLFEWKKFPEACWRREVKNRRININIT